MIRAISVHCALGCLAGAINADETFSTAGVATGDVRACADIVNAPLVFDSALRVENAGDINALIVVVAGLVVSAVGQIIALDAAVHFVAYKALVAANLSANLVCARADIVDTEFVLAGALGIEDTFDVNALIVGIAGLVIRAVVQIVALDTAMDRVADEALVATHVVAHFIGTGTDIVDAEFVWSRTLCIEHALDILAIVAGIARLVGAAIVQISARNDAEPRAAADESSSAVGIQGARVPLRCQCGQCLAAKQCDKSACCNAFQCDTPGDSPSHQSGYVVESIRIHAHSFPVTQRVTIPGFWALTR